MTYLYENNAAGTLASPITNSATTLTLNSGQAALFPNPISPDTFFATLTDAATQTFIEIVSVTAVAGNVMTIVRAQDGTSARSWNSGDILSQRVIAAELRNFQGGAIPIGGIIMWSGSVATIPENWTLCNGSSGTPNLMDSFVVGAGNSYSPGNTGGSTNALINHTHGVIDPGHGHSVNDPGHIHVQSSATFYNAGPGSFQGPGTVGINLEPTLTTNSSLTNVVVNGANTGISIASAGSTSNSLPPYYALCYIMRIA